MSLLTINKLTDSVGAEVLGVDADRLASDDALGAAVLDALEDNGVLVFPGLGPGSRSAGGVLPPARRDRPLLRRASSRSPGIYPVTLDKSKNSSADYLRGHLRLAHRRLHPDRGHVPPDGHRAVGEAGRRARRRDRVRELVCGLRRVDRRGEGAVRVAAGRALAGGLPAPGHPRPRHRRCWRDGGPGAPTSTRWCGRTAAAASRWCSARRPTTSSAWIATRARALLAELLDRATVPDKVYSHKLVGRRHRHLGQPRRPAPRGAVRPRLAAGDAAHHGAGRRADPVRRGPPSLTAAGHYGNLIPIDENHVLVQPRSWK